MSWSHRLATLESSPSFATIIPVNTSSTNHTTSRSSPFERRLAKYRSLPLLWLRTCGSSHHQQKRRTTADNIHKNTILLLVISVSLRIKYDLLYIFISFFIRKKKLSKAIYKTFSLCEAMHTLTCFTIRLHKEQNDFLTFLFDDFYIVDYLYYK
jgi:hypothetical protein